MVNPTSQTKAPDAQNKTAQQPAQPSAQEQLQNMVKQFTTNIVGSIWDGVKTPVMWVVGLGLFAYMAVTGKLGDILNGLGNMLGFGDGAKAEAAQPPATTTNTPTQPQTPATNQPRQQMQAQITNDDSKPNSAMLNDKGELVAGNKPKEKIDPLSTVKAMTFYTALTKCGPDFVKANDTLFKNMLSNSNNEDAEKIAKLAGDKIATNGGSARFIEEMNKLAKAKGINNTNFTNASGLPDPNMYSTAEDMAKWSFLIAKEFPEYSKKYMETDKVNTAKRAGLSDSQTDTFKTGTGEGFHGQFNQKNRAGARSGIGSVDINKDGVVDGSFSVAEVPTGRGVSYGDFVKEIAKRSKEFANSDVATIENSSVAQFPPMETPQTKPIPANTKTK
jgi:hypothetical protein